MISLGTIWLRTGVMARGRAFPTCGLALVLLLSIGLSQWVVPIFPAWVLLISVVVLVRNLNDRPGDAAGAPDPVRIDRKKRDRGEIHSGSSGPSRPPS